MNPEEDNNALCVLSISYGGCFSLSKPDTIDKGVEICNRVRKYLTTQSVIQEVEDQVFVESTGTSLNVYYSCHYY